MEINLKELDHLTRNLTPVSDMALLLGVSEVRLRPLLNDLGTPEGQVYRRARAETALRIRKRSIELADAGSPTAAAAVEGYLQAMLMDE